MIVELQVPYFSVVGSLSGHKIAERHGKTMVGVKFDILVVRVTNERLLAANSFSTVEAV